jgi:hypothetical protein
VTNILSIPKLIFSIGLSLILWTPLLKANENSIEDFLTNDLAQLELGSTQMQIDTFNASSAGITYQYTSSTPRKLPTTYREAVLDHDVPIEMIQELHELSFDHWHNKDFTDEEKSISKSYNVDLNNLKEANTRAYSFWKNLVACNQNNANKARIHFMMITDDIDLCENGSGELDNAKSKELLTELKIIKTNFQSFYSEINLNFSESLKTLKSNNIFNNIFQNIHPVLVQFLVMQWSFFVYSPYENLKKDLLLKLNHLDLLLKVNYLSASTSNYSYAFEPLINNDDKILLKWTLNSTAILSLVHFQNYKYPCGVYGLWPILNSTLITQNEFIINPIMMVGSANAYCGNQNPNIASLFNNSFFYFSALPYHRNYLQLLNNKLTDWGNLIDPWGMDSIPKYYGASWYE